MSLFSAAPHGHDDPNPTNQADLAPCFNPASCMAMMVGTMTLVLSCICLIGSILGTYFTGVVAMDEWLEHFGDTTDANGNPAISSSQLSLLSSIVQVGEFVGALVAGFVGNQFGRRGGLVAASICVSVGAIIQMVTESDRNYWVGGRVVLGLGVGLISSVSRLPAAYARGVGVDIQPDNRRCPPVSLRKLPCWCSWCHCRIMAADASHRSSECSPSLGCLPACCLRSDSLYLTETSVQVIGACVAQGTQAMNNTGAWRIPVGLNFAIPLIFMVFVWFVPESARWYISKNRDDDARRSLERLSRGNPHADVPQALELLKEDRLRSSEDENDNSSWSSLLTNPIERRKLLCAAGMLFGQQIGGVQFIFRYALPAESKRTQS